MKLARALENLEILIGAAGTAAPTAPWDMAGTGSVVPVEVVGHG